MHECKWLIDDNGQFWAHGDQRLVHHLQTSGSSHDIWSFCILNLGFVEVERRPDRLRIRARPLTATSTALAALLYWLQDDSPVRSVLSLWSNDTWSDEIIGDRRRLQARICSLPAAAKDPHGTWFIRRRTDVKALASHDAIAKALRVLTKPNVASISLVSQFCDELFLGRFTIVQRDPDGRHSIVSQGQGYTIYGREYLQNAIGTCIEDDPNAEYGRWVAQGLRDVFREQRPIVEDVSAALIGRRGRQRISYRRVMLNLPSRPGTALALTASRLRSIVPLHHEVV